MKTKWTQRMSMHLNGGSKFSELVSSVFADGKETGITRRTRTSGSPQYLKTIDELQDGDDTFDVLATRGSGMEEWLNGRLALQSRTSHEEPKDSSQAEKEYSREEFERDQLGQTGSDLAARSQAEKERSHGTSTINNNW